MKNKKGSIADIGTVAGVLLFFAMIVLIMFRIYSGIDDKLQDQDDLNTRTKTISTKMKNLYPGVFDGTFLFMTVGLTIGAFALAALARVHPLFLVLYLIVLTIIIIVCGAFSNIYSKAAANSDFVLYADQLIFMSHIMKTLPFIVGVLGSVLAIIMYKSWRGAQKL
jgi:hypothetical protein